MEEFAAHKSDKKANLGQSITVLSEKIKLHPAPVVLYGAGLNLAVTIIYAERLGISAQYLCDRDFKKAEDNLYRLIPLSLDELVKRHRNDYILITIELQNQYLDAYHSLISKGFSADNLFEIRTYTKSIAAPELLRVFGEPDPEAESQNRVRNRKLESILNGDNG